MLIFIHISFIVVTHVNLYSYSKLFAVANVNLSILFYL